MATTGNAADSSAVAAPWLKPLTRTITLNASIAFSKYFQLATVSAQGMPSVRTVVYRGMSADNIIMVTDQRSEKMQHLRAQPHAEIAWYFPLTREQFRIFGRVVTIDCSTEEADAEASESADSGAASSSAASSTSSTSSWRAVFASRADAAAYRQRAWAAQTDTARLSYDQAHPGHPRPVQSRSDLDKVRACRISFETALAMKYSRPPTFKWKGAIFVCSMTIMFPLIFLSCRSPVQCPAAGHCTRLAALYRAAAAAIARRSPDAAVHQARSATTRAL